MWFVRIMEYFAIAAALSACSTAKHSESHPPSVAVAQLASYEHRNGAQDAENDFRNGKARFLAVQGYALSVPGIENFFPKFSDKYKYHVIEGTSDVVENDRQLQLQAVAEAYARAYNLALARLLAF